MHAASLDNYFVQFDQSFRSLLSPLPKKGKMWEVAKRVAIVVVAPFVYLARAIIHALTLIFNFRAAPTPDRGEVQEPGRFGNPAPETFFHRESPPELRENHLFLEVKNKIIEKLTEDFGTNLQNNEYAAFDIIVQADWANGHNTQRESQRRTMGVKNSQLPIANINRHIDSLLGTFTTFFRSHNPLIIVNQQGRSDTLSVRWLVLLRGNNGEYSYCPRRLFLTAHESTITGEPRYHVSEALATQACNDYSVTVDINLNLFDDYFKTISQRNAPENYSHILLG